MSLAAEVINFAKEKNCTIGTIESMTGGKIAAALTSVAGSSSVFIGSVVSYNVSIKEKVVGVPPEIIDEHGVVSAEVAHSMANHGKKVLGVDYCISITGNAGPSQEKDDKGVGTVYIGFAGPKLTYSISCHYVGNREEIRDKAVNDALKNLLAFMKTF